MSTTEPQETQEHAPLPVTGGPAALPTHAWILCILASIAVAAACIVFLWPWLQSPQEYPEPIVGLLPWSDGDKHQDMRAFYGFFVLACALMILLQQGFAWANVRISKVRRDQLLWAGWAVSGPIIGWMLPTLLQQKAPAFPDLWLALFLCGWVWIAALAHRAVSDPQTDLLRLALSGVASMGLAFFAGLAALTAASHMGLIGGSGIYEWCPWLAAAGVLVALLVMAVRAPSLAVVQGRVLFIGRAAGMFLPLFWFCIVPQPIGDSPALNGDRTPQILLLATVLWGASTAWNAWRLIKNEGMPLSLAPVEGQHFWSRFFLPGGIIALAGFLASTPLQPPQLPPDMWHTGEAMLPWHQLWHFGSLPYVDFNGVLGFTLLIKGALNQVLFNGWICTYPHVEVLLLVLCAALAAGVAWWSAGPLAAVAVALLMGPTYDRLQLLAPAMFLLACPWLVARPSKWLSVWLALAPACILYNTTTGAALALASFPLALWMVVRARRDEPRALARWLGAAAIVAIALAALTPLVRIAQGWLTFLWENQYSYVQAEGDPLSETWRSTNFATNLAATSSAYGVIIFAWLLFAAGGFMLAFAQWRKPRNQFSPWGFVLTWLPAATVLAMIKWTGTRLEFQNLDRSGMVSFICVAQVLPLWFLHRSPGLVSLCRPNLVGAAITLLALTSLFQLSPFARGQGSALVARAVETRAIAPGYEELPPGQATLGGAISCIALAKQAQSLPALLAVQKQLPSDTVWFDASNQNLLYLYLDKKVPSRYSGVYYLANDRMQRAVIDELQAAKTDVIILSPLRDIGMGVLSLRSTRLFRWIMNGYRPVTLNGWTLALHKTAPASPEEQWKDARELEDVWGRDSYFYQNANLLDIPAAWGGSLSQITANLDLVADLTDRVITVRIPDSVPKIASPKLITLEGLNTPPGEADYLALELMIPVQDLAGGSPVMRLDWKTATGQVEPTPVRFTLPEKRTFHSADTPPDMVLIRLLVPLGWRPAWVLGPKPVSLRIGADNPRSLTSLEIKSARFWKLKP